MAYSLPKSPKGTYSLAQVDANIYFGKVTIELGRNEADFEVWGSASHGRLGRWNVPFPTTQYGAAGIVRSRPITLTIGRIRCRYSRRFVCCG